jgi:hypothetical protein
MVELPDWAANIRGIIINSESNLDMVTLSLACVYIEIQPSARRRTAKSRREAS